MNNKFSNTLFALLTGLLFQLTANAQVNKMEFNIVPFLNAYNVSWDMPGPTSTQSVPTGNGDIGLNVWVEPSGDLCFFIGKTDAWGAAAATEKNNWIKDGGVLMKLGKVRISVSPNPMAQQGSPFRQVLKLHSSEILVTEGTGANAVQLRVWVDANHPVIRVESKSVKPVSVKVTLDNWRVGRGDTILPKQANKITWYHQNPGYADRHLQGIVFGGIIKGKGMTTRDDTTLETIKAVNSQLVSVYPLTTKNLTPDQWSAKLNSEITRIDALPLEQERLAHQQWWNKFWLRSWIFVNGDDVAKTTTQGYILQRYITACAGRGAYPIKFNGSIFVVDNPQFKANEKSPATAIDADYREWGGQYWMQNTRAMYWPRLMAGDFDEMRPLFKMYLDMLPGNKAQVQSYYHHEGCYFQETSPFWGGLPYMGPEVPENWTAHYFTPILELSMMMLDYYEYTGDKKFARETLLPIASAGVEFFDKHFGRDAQGKLLLDPDNSIEMFWKAHDPAPDIAGLHSVVARLMALPPDLTDEKSRENWKRFYNVLPDLPIGEKDGKQVLLPYTGPQTVKGHNLENPELYAIYPFRLYGLGKPGLQMAINTFNARAFKDKGCWVQDPVQAAMLGLTDVARAYVIFNFARKESTLKFPAFWATGHDYAPDEDNGGNGENGLQEMLMQVDGKKIILLPAWPKDWGNTEFKLNAPYNTTVQGRIVNGKLMDLVVTPVSRKTDVIDLSK